MATVNWLAILTSAVLAFVIGAIWYAPQVFGKAWMRENGFTPESLRGASVLKIFGTAFVLTFIWVFNLAMFLGSSLTLEQGATYGFLAGFGWVAMGFGIVYLFERKSFVLFAINAGYLVVCFTLAGVVLGAWH